MPRVRTYDPTRPFVALKALTFGDRTFAPGEVVPWRDLGLSELRLYRLWGQYKVGHVDAPVPDALGGFEVLARIGAAFAAPPPPPAPPPAKAKPKRASAEA